MECIICNISAWDYWRTPPVLRDVEIPLEIALCDQPDGLGLDWPRAIPRQNARQLDLIIRERLLTDLKGVAPPVHMMLPEGIRYSSELITAHRIPKNLPREWVVDIGGNIGILSPALLLTNSPCHADPIALALGMCEACGIYATSPDFAVRFIAFLGVSMPNFWLAFLLVMAFSVYLQWLPAMGYGGWQHIILPAVSIAFMSLAINARLLRASMLDVAGQRHVTWARLRGLNDKQTERRHILRNASLPMITAVGMHIGELIGGTMIIENIFAWPGVGRYAVSAIFNRDYPVIQCFTLMMVVVFVVCNLIVDLLNAALDPRIRRHEGAHA